MGWVIVAGLVLAAVSALLSDLQLRDTAATNAHVQAILHGSGEDPIP